MSIQVLDNVLYNIEIFVLNKMKSLVKKASKMIKNLKTNLLHYNVTLKTTQSRHLEYYLYNSVTHEFVKLSTSTNETNDNLRENLTEDKKAPDGNSLMLRIGMINVMKKYYFSNYYLIMCNSDTETDNTASDNSSGVDGSDGTANNLPKDNVQELFSWLNTAIMTSSRDDLNALYNKLLYVLSFLYLSTNLLTKQFLTSSQSSNEGLDSNNSGSTSNKPSYEPEIKKLHVKKLILSKDYHLLLLKMCKKNYHFNFKAFSNNISLFQNIVNIV